jgi:hypothetical protein
MGVPWARAMAIHARWRWPPDSSPTGRSASSTVAVATRAALTTASSSEDHRWNQRWWG